MTAHGTVRRVFPGGNTAVGFHSFYDYVVGGGARRVYILKGGPGSGKSTFMQHIGREMMARGWAAEMHHCAADADSLDGIVFPDIGVGLLDGTAPHAVDPRYPGLVDEIVDLGRFCDAAGLEQHRRDIVQLREAGSAAYDRAYAYLAAARHVRNDWARTNARRVEPGFVYEQTLRIVRALFADAPTVSPPGHRRHLFAAAITPDGPVHFLDTLVAPLQRVFVVRGSPGTGRHELVSTVARTATERGCDVEMFHCPLDADTVDHVVIPALKAGVFSLAADDDFRSEGADETDLDAGLTSTADTSLAETDANMLSARNTARRLDISRKSYGHLLAEAIASLKDAQRIHMRREAIYAPTMDFRAIDRERDEVLTRILTLATKAGVASNSL